MGQGHSGAARVTRQQQQLHSPRAGPVQRLPPPQAANQKHLPHSQARGTPAPTGACSLRYVHSSSRVWTQRLRNCEDIYNLYRIQSRNGGGGVAWMAGAAFCWRAPIRHCRPLRPLPASPPEHADGAPWSLPSATHPRGSVELPSPPSPPRLRENTPFLSHTPWCFRGARPSAATARSTRTPSARHMQHDQEGGCALSAPSRGFLKERKSTPWRRASSDCRTEDPMETKTSTRLGGGLHQGEEEEGGRGRKRGGRKSQKRRER